MKNVWTILPLVLLLHGCGTQETVETVADEWAQPVMASPRSISVELPPEAAAPVLESDLQQVYLCEDYEIMLETLTSGDLRATIKQISGCDQDTVTLMQTASDNVQRYEFVWAAAGEDGDRLGRAAILDDGQYHYCLSVLRDANSEKTKNMWNEVFRSFRLN